MVPVPRETYTKIEMLQHVSPTSNNPNQKSKPAYNLEDEMGKLSSHPTQKKEKHRVNRIHCVVDDDDDAAPQGIVASSTKD
jgi:hypothetical protein